MNEAARVAALTLDGVERRYGRGETTVEVLTGASLELAPGQSVALVAPSGAGKSTLLHLAGLLERPNAGEVMIGGAATSTMSDDKRTALRRTEIGFVYQFHHLLPEFSALENLVLPQMIAGLSRAQAAIRGRELLAYLGLAQRETHRPAELSGGEQQRVAIARAVANAPQGCCWPTSRPAISIRRPPTTYSRRLRRWSRRAASPPSSPRTTWISQPAWTVGSRSARGGSRRWGKAAREGGEIFKTRRTVYRRRLRR